jgi:ribosomal protein S18 acetylase RimI-like enzyme
MRSRPYAGPADLRLTQDLVLERWRRLGASAGWHIGDFAWWIAHDRRLLDAAADRVHLWLDDGQDRALASAWIDGHGTLDLEVLPSVDQADPLAEALRWHQERVARLIPAERHMGLASVYAMDGDPRRIELLGEAGFTRGGDGRDLVLSRSLADGGPQTAALPVGWQVRPFRPEAELDGMVDLHRAAFGSSLTADAYRRVVATWPYRADLDWVAVAPDGELAAFCLCWLDQANRAVTLEPVGCRPEHQRRGVARATCSAAIRHAAGLGATVATVCGDPETVPAWGLYDSLGFRPAVERLRFERPLEAATRDPG